MDNRIYDEEVARMEKSVLEMNPYQRKERNK